MREKSSQPSLPNTVYRNKYLTHGKMQKYVKLSITELRDLGRATLKSHVLQLFQGVQSSVIEASC